MALKVAEKVDDSTMMLSQINNDLGGFFSHLGEYEKAVTSYNKGLNIAEKYRDTTSIFLLARNISNAYVKLNKPHDALKIIKNISKKYAHPGQCCIGIFHCSFLYKYLYKFERISKGPALLH